MHDDILNELDNCFDEFQDLLLSDTFISQKQYNSFLEKHKDSLELVFKYPNLDKDIQKKGKSILNNGYSVIEKRNEKFIINKLIDYNDYFDNMFKKIDNSIVLDREQRKAIIIDEDYSLIIAGAGSGKTTTMCAKIKYLIEKQNINPNEILIISSNNNATDELNKRINKDFKLNMEVLTFHKLGMKILKKRTDKPLQIISDDIIYKFICGYLTNVIFKNKEKFKLFLGAFNEYVNFDKSALKYDSFNNYFKNYINIVYEKNKNNLEDYIIKRTKARMNSYRGIDGIKYNSKQEVIIANYLFRNGYKYKYENVYPTKQNNGSYKPDFTIDNNGIKTYIEYYGLTKLQANNKYSIEDIETYNLLVEKKKQLHEQCGQNLIELYADYDNDENYIEILNEELKNRNIKHTPRTNKELFYTLLSTYTETNYYHFVDLALKFIKKYKEMDYELNYFNTLILNGENKKIKLQLKFLKEIYIAYNKSIHNKYLIDYDDMINYSCSEIKQIKDCFNYKYIIVDEFQDISIGRYRLIKTLSDLYNAKIVAVGDDWQAIYNFSGTDIDLLTNFSDVMGYSSVNKIIKTYRNSQELVEVAGNFVSQNIAQFNKDLISNKHLSNPVEIDYYYKEKGNSKATLLNNLIKKIYKHDKGSILLLGRYKSDINYFIDSPYFSKGPHNKIICKKNRDIDIDFLTVNKAKGLGYDNVIILNGLNTIKGFPSKENDDILIKMLDNSKEELIPFAEERRLFYVALTRTKNKVYILAPYIPKSQRSDFIIEICDMDNVIENINYVNKYIEKEQ